MNWKGKEARFAAFTQGAIGPEGTNSEQTWEEELHDVDAEVRELEERLRVLGERQGELQEAVNQEAVNEEAEASRQSEESQRWQNAVNEEAMGQEEDV